MAAPVFDAQSPLRYFVASHLATRLQHIFLPLLSLATPAMIRELGSTPPSSCFAAFANDTSLDSLNPPPAVISVLASLRQLLDIEPIISLSSDGSYIPCVSSAVGAASAYQSRGDGSTEWLCTPRGYVADICLANLIEEIIAFAVGTQNVALFLNYCIG